MTVTWEAPAATGAGSSGGTSSGGTSSGGTLSLARQAGIGLAAAGAYLLARGAVVADGGRALDNARAVAGLERAAGLDHEAWLRARLGAGGALTGLGEWLYSYGHWVVAVATLMWLARRHPVLYRRTRDAMLVSAAVALFVFVVYPVAPPDLPGDPAGGAYAALPSLQAGWDLLAGLAFAVAARHAAAKAAGVVLAAVMAASVVLAGGHRLVDAVAGAALTGACWLYLWARRRPAPLRGYAGWDGLDLR